MNRKELVDLNLYNQDYIIWIIIVIKEVHMFIAREKELRFLSDIYHAKGGQLVVLYGRRRVGKTEVLREFCKDKQHVFYSCTQTTDSAQLENFSNAMFKEDIPAKKYVGSFDNWESAFKSCLDLPYNSGKKLVVIDEFPYMCQANSSIPSILQNLFDSDFKDSEIMLVLCGSSMSFIEKDLLSEKNPLYGRATGIYRMTEMDFYDSCKFFPKFSAEDKVYAYSILGGIPHYLKQFDDCVSLEENIKNRILTKGCVLYSEVEFLLHQELREVSVYNSIIQAIASGSTKLNEISQKSLIDNSSKTGIYLRNLNELGLVVKEFPITEKQKKTGNSRNGYYRLTDSFFRFWYNFCFPNLSVLEDGDVGGLYEYTVKPGLNHFASLAFEDVCRQFIKRQQFNGALPFRYSKIGRWFGKTKVQDSSTSSGFITTESEVDILCADEHYKNYLVGECKFKNSDFTYSDYLNTISKFDDLKAEANFYYYLFSKSGFSDSVVEEASKAGNVFLYELEDVVSNN